MKNRKTGIGSRLLHLLLCICLAAGIAMPCAVPVSAAGGSCGSSTTWEFSNGVLKLNGNGPVSIFAWASYNSQITSVVVGDGITEMLSSMFVGHSTLQSISFGKSLKTIPASFCADCPSLTAIQFADGLQSISKGAFRNCARLTSVTLPSTLKEIGDQAFFSCIRLKSVTIPDSVTTIGSEAFKGNNATSVKLGKGLKTIGSEAFNCSCFSEVEIPDSVTEIGTNAFGVVYDSVSRAGTNLSYYYTGTERKVLIIGKKDGAAQKYANAGGFPFRVAGEAAEHTHSWSNWTVKVKAGCETEGQTVRTCSVCGETETQTLKPTGHKMGEWQTKTAATCEKEGVRIRTCTVCGAEETEQIPAAGHQMSDWKVKTAATCEKDGEKVKTCKVCGKEESERIPATGHQMSDWKVKTAATCEKEGEKVKTCTVCGKEESERIPATGHSWGDWKITKEPTLDAAGEQQCVCAICGEKRTTEVAKLVGYQVSVSVSEGGSVTPSGESKVEEGGKLTLKIKADQGWQLASVFVNGKEMKPDSTGEILLNDIRSNQNIAVVFQKKEQPKTRKCNFVDITPKRTAWLTDETGLSMKDFTVSANISDNGMVSWLDITKDCVPAVNGMPKAEPYGTGSVSFRYQGSDAAVKEYLEKNSITGQIPLYLRGDGDANGIVDVVDAEIALNSYVVRLTGNQNDGISEVQRAVMDVDGNGETSLEDAAFILQYYTQQFVGLKPDWKKVISKQ